MMTRRKTPRKMFLLYEFIIALLLAIFVISMAFHVIFMSLVSFCTEVIIGYLWFQSIHKYQATQSKTDTKAK